MHNRVDFNLYLITDRHQVAPNHTLLSAVEAALRGGVKAVQLREKDLSFAELKPIAVELRKLTSEYGTKLFINHHVDLVKDINADGVHLGGQSMSVTEARKQLGPEKLIGVSTHSKQEILSAAAEGADFVTFGPVYSTPSKAALGKPQGLSILAEACQTSPLPVFALGGIKQKDTADVMAAGAYGVALISAIIASPSPEEAAQAFTA